MRKLSISSFLCLSFVLFAALAAAQTSGKNPVIIIPGVTGSELVNPTTGKTVWFDVRRDKDDDLRLPMTSPVLARNRDSLRAKDIIRKVDVPILPDVEVYQTLIDALIARGFTEADWNKPVAADVFYVFPYDWRRDNVETAQLLIRKITAAKRALRRPNLKFDIISHSMGGLVARYAAMYGAADLPREGVTPVPTWAGGRHINKLMMFGTPNEGAFTAFDALLNGYPIIGGRNLPFIDSFRPEDLLTNPAAYQIIPHQSSARFLDENLQRLNIDIYSVETWLKYGWGALSDPKFLSKLKDADRLAITNDEIKPVQLKDDAKFDDRIVAGTTYAQARAFLASALSRAKRFHLALDAQTKRSPIQLYAYGGNCEQTLDAVVLVRDEKKERWTTLVDARDIKTSTGKEVKKDEVRAAMFAIGDGRVTKRSLLAETPVGKDAGPDLKTNFPVTSSFFACGKHYRLFLEQEIQDSFLSALVVEKQNQP